MKRPSLPLPFVLLLSACSTEVVDPADDPDAGAGAPATTRERLAEPATLTLSTESRVKVHAALTWPERREEDVVLEVAGTFESYALPDGSIALDALAVEVGDVIIPAETLPPNGIHLTDVRLILDGPAWAEGAWTFDDERGVVELELDLTLEWSIVTSDGEAHPLAPQHLEGVRTALMIESDAQGRLVARLDAEREGTFFAWSGLMELSDLEVTLRASEAPSSEGSL
jgi:hypothetical protein